MNLGNPDAGSFIGEAIDPKPGSFDVAAMATGAPGVSREFTWREKGYTVAEVLETWKTTSPCRSGADEQYVRKHFYRIRTTSGDVMTLYCTRQPPRGGSKTKGRWVLYSVQA